jgi:uncharacterized repeat protein (TIGR02543 family)
MKSNKKRILIVLAILTMALVLSCALVACTKADTPDAPKKEFTITFDTQGGSEVKPITIAEGATITLPRNPTKEGYIFDGWYLSDEFIEKFNATQTISSNITVYAKWKEDGGNQDEKQSYTITFDTQGGSEVKSLVLKEGETITLPSNPTKEGSVFDGWYLDSSYTQAFDSTKRIDSNMVLYAKWKILDDGQSIIASDYFDINGLVLTMNKQKYITSSEDVFDLRNKFSTSNGSSWRAFTSPNCDQPTEITTRTANVSAGWNNIYVMVENLTTYENQIYRLKIYKYPTIVYKALEEGFWEIQSVSDCGDVLFPDDKIDNITSIGEHAFSSCPALRTLQKLPKLTSIGPSAFANCKRLTSITIPGSVTSIGNSAFSGCTGLTSITIPNSVTSIGDGAFKGCNNLTSMTLPFVGASVTAHSGYDEVFGYIFGYTTTTKESSTVSGATYQYYGNSKYYHYYIPSSITSVTITGRTIPYCAFYNCTGLTSVTIPDGVTSIGAGAFWGCTGLTSVTIPDSVTSIGGGAFAGCTSLITVTIPDGVTSIGVNAFNGCTGLTSVTIGNGVTSIGSWAFEGCTGLKSVYITDFAKWCSVSFDSENANPLYYAYNLYLNEKKLSGSVEIPVGGKTIPYGTFRGCTGLTSVTIPDSVTSIGGNAFYGCTGLTNITIPDSVTSIGGNAFYGCTRLTNVTIPDSVTSIGAGALKGCSSLVRIKIPFVGASKRANNGYDQVFGYIFGYETETGSSTTIYGATRQYFSGSKYYWYYIPTSLKSVVISEGATTISSSAFNNCIGLTSITIPDSVTSIGLGAFNGCYSLESITIPFVGAKAGVTSNSENQYPFGYIFGTTEYVGGAPTTQYYYGDSGTTSTKYYIPYSLNSVTVTGGNILYGAFYDCTDITGKGLKSVTIGNGVTSIGERAFYGCTNLKSVTIGNGVTSIGDSAFYKCYSLTSVYYTGDIVGWCGISGLGALMSSSRTLYIDGNKVEGEMIIPDSVTSIGKYAFGGCTGLTSVTIGNSVTSIGERAFQGCTGLTSVTIPDSVTSIGDSAFSYCTGLTSILVADGNSKYHSSGNCIIETSSKILILGCKTSEIPSDGSVTSIGNYAFAGCTGLTSVTIPDSMTSIGYRAFQGCTVLTSITIPDRVTSIGGSAFEGCSDLTTVSWNATECTSAGTDNYPIFKDCSNLATVNIGDKVKIIPSNAFRSCTGLTSITIPDSVTSIGERAFFYCTGLTSVTIGNGVTNIGDSAFYKCSKLTSVTIGNSVTSIGARAFDVCNGLTSISGSATNVGTVAKQAKPTSFTVNITSGTSIGDYAFYKCTGLTSITIPDSVTSIGGNAFYGCSRLMSVTIPDSVTSIGSDAFFGCDKLQDIYITDIAAWCNISGLSNLMKYDASNKKLYINNETATSITIPDGVTEIPSYAFRGCSGLTSVTIGSGVKSIGDWAFYKCSKLTSVTIGNSVTSIGYGAFEGCTGLTSVTIGNSVTSIGYGAFEGCAGLTSITFNGTKAQWNAISKGTGWKKNIPATKVVCTDGTVSI